MCFDGENLIGKTIKEIRGAEKYSEEITIITECGEVWECTITRAVASKYLLKMSSVM